MKRSSNAPKAKIVSFTMTDLTKKQIEEILLTGRYLSRSEVVRQSISQFHEQLSKDGLIPLKNHEENQRSA